MVMKIDGKQADGRLIVSVEGRMDAVSAPGFDRKCEEWLAAGEVVFILDFSGLEYISSAGLRSLLVLGKKLTVPKGRIVIAALKDVVKEVFTISGFGSIFTIVESVDAALGLT
jgi:anti-sigma B factor antagonist